MKIFVVVLAAFVALTQARPQYNYPAPQPQIPTGSYGVPGTGGFAINSGFSNSINTGSSINTGFTSGTTSHIGAINSGYTGNYATNGGSSISTIGGGGGGTLIQKHIYVHVAPPEPEEFRQQQQIAAAQATKHYKIIFIKAPSPPTYTAPTIPLQAQNQEKTIVYVLVKKPEDQAEINIPTATPTQPSKPEVYFIRYKAQKEVSGGGGGAIGGINQIYNDNAGIGGISGSVSSSSSSSTIIGGGNKVSTNYGPPGQSGPY